MEKVKIISKVNNRVGIESVDLRIKHVFNGNGSSFSIDPDVLEQLMFDEGFRYMIEQGILYIEDMEIKKELGIEPEDAEEPVNIIILSDDQKRRYMTTMPIYEFKKKIDELKSEQLNQLIDFCVDNRLTDFDKCEYIREVSGRDIIRTIQLRDSNKEK